MQQWDIVSRSRSHVDFKWNAIFKNDSLDDLWKEKMTEQNYTIYVLGIKWSKPARNVHCKKKRTDIFWKKVWCGINTQEEYWANFRN